MGDMPRFPKYEPEPHWYTDDHLRADIAAITGQTPQQVYEQQVAGEREAESRKAEGCA